MHAPRCNLQPATRHGKVNADFRTTQSRSMRGHLMPVSLRSFRLNGSKKRCSRRRCSRLTCARSAAAAASPGRTAPSDGVARACSARSAYLAGGRPTCRSKRRSARRGAAMSSLDSRTRIFRTALMPSSSRLRA